MPNQTFVNQELTLILKHAAVEVYLKFADKTRSGVLNTADASACLQFVLIISSGASMHASASASLRIAKLVVSGRKMTAFVNVLYKIVLTKMEASDTSIMRVAFVNVLHQL